MRDGLTLQAMIDERTGMARHAKWTRALLFAILAFTVVLEALG